ncbi:coenzyme PQQ synthesis protein B [Sphaerisporangium siamense]|uniref:Coenzyme PQQ synthesis protein B n=1 Tax=Sphaerisporangium siamense TaxID=795645 RepID=A0A7W7D658_9ACTN|nr:MBL fold metallo-hydrolase [Sphaerisporangium siamense]MBB4701010.1 pyrroloquinoline quinone biosynthesis protein B [Sphaerisporangium siamense]GII85845.1 coenzyme PQQ synthesis protein B [Sphaerisporangium siamense]
MRVQLLGTAAGGGVPQWNCACPGCTGARAHPDRRRRHASLAVETGGGRTYIVNATPDIGDQIEAYEALHPGPERRHTPVAGLILTDAELDHTLGVARLREAGKLEIWSTPVVREALTERLMLGEVLAPYTGLSWHDVPVSGDAPLAGGVEAGAVPISPKRPRYAAGPPDGQPWVIALRLSDRDTGATLIYAPAMGAWAPGLEAAMAAADCVIVDGTFWDDEEPRRTGISRKTAIEMGHLPIEATAERLSRLPGRVLYTHLNNTNPLVDPEAPQHRVLADLGVGVAAEGTVIEL